jgi:hypothetical protein
MILKESETPCMYSRTNANAHASAVLLFCSRIIVGGFALILLLENYCNRDYDMFKDSGLFSQYPDSHVVLCDSDPRDFPIFSIDFVRFVVYNQNLYPEIDIKFLWR